MSQNKRKFIDQNYDGVKRMRQDDEIEIGPDVKTDADVQTDRAKYYKELLKDINFDTEEQMDSFHVQMASLLYHDSQDWEITPIWY